MGTFRQGMLRHGGFTLIELMVTIGVAAIVLTLAIPSFESAINSNRLAGAANEMIASLQTARMEAVRRGHRTVVCFSGNANDGVDATCASSDVDGWISFVDTNKDGDFDKGTDEFLRGTTVDQRVEVTGTVAAVVYRSDGLAHTSTGLLTADLDMCIPTTQPTENLRRVSIGAGGSRVSVEPKDNSGACS